MNQILLVNNLVKRFKNASGSTFTAVDNISFTVDGGEAVGLVGESGSGKTTVIRMLAHLLEPTDGQIRFLNHDINTIPNRSFSQHRLRSKLQMVFQDPSESLNPSWKIGDIIAEPLRCHGRPWEPHTIKMRVEELCDMSQIPRGMLSSYPHQLSGGQKARVGIARALITAPTLLLLDEPTTALDASIQAKILALLAEFRKKMQMSYVFVSHDLSVVRLLCDKIMIMKEGQIIERGPTHEIFKNPQHEYTRALLSAIPNVADE